MQLKFYYDSEEPRTPDKQLELVGSGSGSPPRRTAVGLFDYGDEPANRVGPWKRFVALVSDHFRRLPRQKQEQLITRFCQTTLTACSIGISLFLYPYLPTLVAVVTIPVILTGCWQCSGYVLSQLVINQFELKLNESENI